MTLRKGGYQQHFCDTMLGYTWALVEFTKRSSSESHSNLTKCERGIVWYTNHIEPVRIKAVGL